MAAEADIPFAALIEPIARQLLGEPNRALSSKTELRYGTRGSLSVDLRKGVWRDHETGEGGGALDLVTRQTGLREAERLEWVAENTDWKPDHDRRPNGRAGNGTRHQPKLGPIVATYDYVDEAGSFLFQVTRHYPPKDFRQRRRPQAGDDPSKIHDGWFWGTKGCRWVPYRLPDLIEALSNDSVVFFVEGEKDADNLWRVGLPATTNPMGAGKWRTELNKYFEGADVVVIPDNDPQKRHPKTDELMFHDDGRPVLPGQDHANEVCKHLASVARRVRYLDLTRDWPAMPLKGDVSDWLAPGPGSPDRLYALVDQLPDWAPGQPVKAPVVKLDLINVTLWEGVPSPDRSWAVPNRIPNVNVSLLTGDGGVGKTLIVLQLAVATVLGAYWIGERPEQGPVLFLTAEDDADELHIRLERIVEHYQTSYRHLGDLHLVSRAGADAVLATVDHRGIVQPTDLFQSLERTAEDIRPRWIGIDTAADVFIVDERNRSQVRQCISLLRGLAMRLRTAVLLLAHPSLSGIASGTGLSGSTAWNNSVRSRLYLSRPKKSKDAKDDTDDDDEHDEGDDDVRILRFMKANYGPLAEPVRLVWKDGLLVPPAPPTALQTAVANVSAEDVFLLLLGRCNKQDMTVSPNPTARNFAPFRFADTPESKALNKSKKTRIRLLRSAMDALLHRERIYVGTGPKSAVPSKQSQCLYAGGTLL